MLSLNNPLVIKLASNLLLPQAITAGLEVIINKVLLLNNTSLSLAAINEQTLTLKLAELSFPLSFSISINSNTNSNSKPSIIIVTTLTERSDCTVSTSLATLKKLKANEQVTELIKQGELDVSGDIKVAQQFALLAQSLEIDWQTELAKHLGDVPTHKLVQFGNKLTKSVTKRTKQLEADVSEYIVHEKRLVVTKSQINDFNQQTQEVANKVALVSVRIDKLFTELAKKTSKTKQ